jgi:lipid-A-disaccharide synthase
LPVKFVGHPMIDRYQNAGIKPAAAESSRDPLVLLLPGSRASELERHFPVMLEALGAIKAAIPAASALVVLPNETIARLGRDRLASHANSTGVTVQVGGLAEALARATLAIASTGTVTMECAYFGVPAVTLYKTSWSTYQIGKRVVKVKSLTMPNLLANEPVFPEFVQHTATAANISAAAIELLRQPERRAAIQSRLREIMASLGGPGASRRAAEAILALVP